MCMCGLAFHWQHFGSPAEFMLQTKASFPPLNCEVQQFIFTGAWWLVNGCEDSGWAMIHGLSRAHLGVSFSAPYHYKSFYIITLGNGKCFVAMWLRRVRITGAIFQPPKWNLFCASGCTENAPALFCDVDVFLVCLPPFIIVHVFLWGRGVLVSMRFCYAALILEQLAFGTKAAEAKINSFAGNSILPTTSAFIK